MTERKSSQQTISNLTLLELEQLIENIAKKTLQREILINQKKNTQLFANTFGAWEDDKTDQEIIREIYESRSSNLSSF